MLVVMIVIGVYFLFAMPMVTIGIPAPIAAVIALILLGVFLYHCLHGE